MSITSYGDLKTAIRGWLQDDNLSDFFLDQFIDFSEELHRNDPKDPAEPGIRLNSQRRSATITPGGETIPVPGGYLETHSMSVMFGSRPRTLTPVSDRKLVDLNRPDTSFRKQPRHYSVKNGVIEFDFPVQDRQITHEYSVKLPPLSSSQMSNDLLTRDVSAYLWPCLHFGMMYKDPAHPDVVTWLAKYRAKAISLNRQTEAERYQGGALVMDCMSDAIGSNYR